MLTICAPVVDVIVLGLGPGIKDSLRTGDKFLVLLFLALALKLTSRVKSLVLAKDLGLEGQVLVSDLGLESQVIGHLALALAFALAFALALPLALRVKSLVLALKALRLKSLVLTLALKVKSLILALALRIQSLLNTPVVLIYMLSRGQLQFPKQTLHAATTRMLNVLVYLE